MFCFCRVDVWQFLQILHSRGCPESIPCSRKDTASARSHSMTVLPRIAPTLPRGPPFIYRRSGPESRSRVPAHLYTGGSRCSSLLQGFLGRAGLVTLRGILLRLGTPTILCHPGVGALFGPPLKASDLSSVSSFSTLSLAFRTVGDDLGVALDAERVCWDACKPRLSGITEATRMVSTNFTLVTDSVASSPATGWLVLAAGFVLGLARSLFLYPDS